jgi:hypothetical protein
MIRNIKFGRLISDTKHRPLFLPANKTIERPKHFIQQFVLIHCSATFSWEKSIDPFLQGPFKIQVLARLEAAVSKECLRATVECFSLNPQGLCSFIAGNDFVLIHILSLV